MTTAPSTPTAPTAPTAGAGLRHRELLDRALIAIRERTYWSAYPEALKAYGAESGTQDLAAGRAAFDGYLGHRFDAASSSTSTSSPGDPGDPGDPAQADAAPGDAADVGAERSPYGIELGVTYPPTDIDVMLASAAAGIPAWRDAGPDQRADTCLEILHRINARSHEIAHAVMHTSGQGYAMAFQAGGPHAQDRALEAIAYAYAEMTRHATTSIWEKSQGKRPPQRMSKTFTVVPRGVALVIGCATFPTWNSYPGLFASLVTGNPVVVKPHPGAVLPLAITVAIAREVLVEDGFSPDLVQLAAEAPDEGLARVLALRPEVKIIDYTGSTGFGTWLEQHAHQAAVFTEKAGVNTVVVDSTDDYRGMLANLAFSLSLYSGQMCTTPQNVLVPREGIATDAGHRSVADVARDLSAAVNDLLSDDARATALLGAIVNDTIVERLAEAPTYGDVVLASRPVTHPEFPDATVRTPLLVQVDSSTGGATAGSDPTYLRECFGPISFVVVTDSTDASVRLLRETVRDHGAITAAIYSTDPGVLVAAREAALDAGVALSENLTGSVYVNQSAAFSDFHATGANPAANSALTDAAYVASRFRIVQSRRHEPSPAG